MTKQISPHEWEALSAYLDKELSVKERTRLESRLQVQPELRQALEDLRRTRAILRSQPLLRAPRNFTLTPEMVGQRRPVRSGGGLPVFNFMRFASAFAAVLLVIVLIGDLFSGAPVGRPTAMKASEATIAEEPVMAPFAAEVAGEAQEFGTAEEEIALEAAEEAAAEPGARAAAGTPQPEATGPAALAAPRAPEAGDTLAEGVPPQADEGAGEPPSVLMAPAEEPAQALESQADMANAAEERAPIFTPQMLRGLEIALAALAVIAGLAAFWLRRTGRA